MTHYNAEEILNFMHQRGLKQIGKETIQEVFPYLSNQDIIESIYYLVETGEGHILEKYVGGGFVFVLSQDQ